MKISVIIPTYNAEPFLENQLKQLNKQTIKIDEILIYDSSSKDRTVEIARSYNVDPTIVPQAEFDHGGTRTLAAKRAIGDILVFLTQDSVIFDDKTIENLVSGFQNEQVTAIYGRQLPRLNAQFFEKHLRLFNYPDRAYTREISHKRQYGIKTCFFSNSFSAYRKEALEGVNFFETNLIFGEDTVAVAKMLIKGYTIAYEPEAKVYHSHDYTPIEEFKRYFDIGAFHKNNNWLLDEFGHAESEGMRYVKSELKLIFKEKQFLLIPSMVIRLGCKYIGYRLGLIHNKIPYQLKLRISMTKHWWKKNTIT
ncbi:MAG: glycosyltransferase [Fibrobacterales bacterium]